MGRCVNALKEWAVKASATIIFDSTVDEFSSEGLFDKVKGKRNIAVVGFTTDEDVFGGFYSVPVPRQRQHFYDPSIFAFSFESHGRCKTPQRFVVKKRLKEKAKVCLNTGRGTNGFVYFEAGGWFGLGSERVDAWCGGLSFGFEGLENTTLTGKTLGGNYHLCTRLVAVQLE